MPDPRAVSAQPSLFAPPTIDVSGSVTLNVSVDPREAKRLSAQCEAILSRLRQGPATNRELSTIALKYTGRLSEIKAAGYDVVIASRDYETGLVIYRLERNGASYSERR